MNEQYESSVIKILQANQTDLKNDLDRFERTLYRTELSNSKKTKRDVTTPHLLHQLIIKFFSISSINGLPKIVKSKRSITTVLWSTSFILSSIVCAYTIYNTLDNFLAFDYITKIDMKHEKEIVFPAITLCNYLSDQQKYPDEFIYGMTLNYKSIIPGDFLFRLNMTKFGNSGLYKCIRINGGKNLTGHSTKLMKTNEVGVYNGIQIFLNVTDIEQKGKSIMNGKTFQYFIGNNFVHPTSVEISFFYAVRSLQTNIEMSKTVSKKLGHPYNTCDSHIVNSIIHESSTTYRQAQCFELCTEKFLASECNCTYYGFMRTREDRDVAKDCTSGINRNCTESMYHLFDKVENCASQCPLECDSTEFVTAAMSFGTGANEVRLKFLYSSLRYTEISEVAKVMGTDLFGSLGGTLGLCLGLRLLSFVEILDFFIEVGFVVFRDRTGQH